MKRLKNIMLALDNFSKEQLFEKLDTTNNSLTTIKIGLELFCKHGPSLVHEVYDKYGCDIFLDLKLHDIPNTVKKSIASLEGLPIKYLTLHLSGGEKMLKQAIEQANTSIPEVKILGVSYLTSLSENDFKSIWNYERKDINLAFERLFKLASESGLHGVVCSAFELEIIKNLEKDQAHKLIKVCPGIRFEDEITSGNIQDQNRVIDPKKAFQNGADYIVMGRSLTQTTQLNERIQQLKDIIRSL